jgi:beta-glucanase (GH16 family)
MNTRARIRSAAAAGTGALLLLLATHALSSEAASPQLVWSDEFNGAVGSVPDPTKWTYDTGGGGWGNNELETYTNAAANAQIVSDPNATDGKALAITAIAANGSYTSARIKTEGIYSVQYGRIEARARVPTGVGLWPAFWALGSDITTVGWPASGEIDVMEWIGSYPGQVAGTLHGTNYSGSGLTASYKLPAGQTFSDAYHVFAVDWYPGEIVFSVDGVVYSDEKESAIPAGYAWPFDAPFFVLLNLAVGGNWPGSPDATTHFPQSYLVDYVRVYSLPTTPPPGLVWAPTAPTGVSAYSESTSPVVNVSWQAPSTTFGAALTGYQVSRATDAAFTQNVMTWKVGTSTTFLDTTAQSGTTYYYRVSAISIDGTSDPSAAAQATVNAVGADSRLINISCRAVSEPGSNQLICGFIVGGSGASGNEPVLIRASGPALGAFGLTGTLADPQLTLNQSGAGGTSTVVATNAGWGGTSAIVNAAKQVGAFAWADPKSLDSALLESLPTGAFTAQVTGVSNDSGVALAEVYDATVSPTPTSPRLINISVRVNVGTGSNVLITGFVIGGSSPKTVLIRGSGPALKPFGLTGVLPDPQLSLNSSTANGPVLLATNAGWGGDPEVSAAGALVGAFPWSDTTSHDAAILATLQPGAYTATVSGASGDTGIALIEVYEVP